MSQGGLGPKSGSRHVSLVIASTGQQGLLLYKGAKGVNDAAHSPEGGPAEAGGLSASSLPWFILEASLWEQSPGNLIGVRRI